MIDTPNTAALKALCKAQAAMTGAMKSSNNPHFGKSYADLSSVQDACFPALHANGFSVMHQCRNEDSGSVLDTILIHESGASWTCTVPLLVSKNDMQGLGSAITYARRFGLMCLSGVSPEDDDGNKAAENKPKNRVDRVGAKDKPPADDPFTDEPSDITADLEKVSSITDQDELDSYFKTVRELNPALAKRADFIAACKAQRAVIAANEMPV